MSEDLLKNKTDEELIALYQLGSRPAGDTILRRYKEGVRAKAALYFMMGADREDVVQEGMIGLFNAMRGYNPEMGALFRTYADRCITSEIISAVRRSARLKHLPLNSALSFEAPVSDTEDNTVADTIPAGAESDPEDMTLVAEIEEALEGGELSPLELEVYHRLAAGQNYKEIAEDMDKTSKSIDNAIQRIRKKIQSMLMLG